MFEVGDNVVFGTDGVCTVEKVGPLEIEGVSKDKLYYTLVPFGNPNRSRIFAPVEGKRVVLRKVISRVEADRLIGSIGEIGRLPVEDERKREETYKKVLQGCDCAEIISLIKEIHARREQRALIGKKLPAVDERYFSMAENSLFSELCLPLEIDKSEVRDYISSTLGKSGVEGI